VLLRPGAQPLIFDDVKAGIAAYQKAPPAATPAAAAVVPAQREAA
jgi:hypothetical protein